MTSDAQPGTPGGEREAVEALAAAIEARLSANVGGSLARSEIALTAAHAALDHLAADREPGLREAVEALLQTAYRPTTDAATASVNAAALDRLRAILDGAR